MPDREKVIKYPWYCLKIDIEKSFYRVSHAEALDMLRSITDDERFIELMSIMSTKTDSKAEAGSEVE